MISASYRNNLHDLYLMRSTRNSVDVMLIPDTSGRRETNDHSRPGWYFILCSSLCHLVWLELACVVWYTITMCHIKPYWVSCQQQLLIFSPSAELVFQRLQTRVQVDTRNWKAFCFYLLGFWTLIMFCDVWKYWDSTLCGTKPRILSKTLSGRVCIGQTWGKSQI